MVSKETSALADSLIGMSEQDAVAKVEATGRVIRIGRRDKETFALLCRGETKGIFQLEGGGIRDLLQRMKPDHFRDIIATNALYRPGPLEGGMVGQLRASEIARDRVEDARSVLKIGETVEAKITGVDRKTRIISLSIKAKDNAETQEAMHKMSSDSAASSGTTSLGALLKAKLDNKS